MKFRQTRAGDDDRVAPAVRFLGDAQETAAVVFTKFEVEMLALDLQFLGGDDVVHNWGDVGRLRRKVKPQTGREATTN